MSGPRTPPRSLRALARRTLTLEQRRVLMRRWTRLTAWPPVGTIRFGSLRRSRPFSDSFGFDRGLPVDRYYIDRFLERHRTVAGYAPGAVSGRVLEIGEDRYATRFSDGAIERLDVLDVSSDNPQATLIGDLVSGTGLDDDAFDCVICTQTLVVIYDVSAAMRTLHRILKPGGTLLLTLPGISRICRPDIDVWGDFWRFTTLSARRLTEEVFRPEDVHVEAFGNVLAATAFLYGLAAQELRPRELDLHDPDFQVMIAVRAIKREAR